MYFLGKIVFAQTSLELRNEFWSVAHPWDLYKLLFPCDYIKKEEKKTFA